jgi:peptidoglycan/LPS O-acetylase OafA/YrhL
MSATAPTITGNTSITSSTRTRRTSVPRATVVVGLVAAAVTTAAAAALHAAGVSFDVGGEMIPLAGFAQMTLLGAVIGGVLVAIFNRRSSEPRQRFVQVAVVLTALSCVPSALLPDDAATKVALVALHLLAAAIIVPVLARLAHD